jgi:chromosome segregation ATPase
MDNVADPAGRLDPRNPLIKWVDEMQTVTKMITALIEDSERYRAISESAQHEHAELRAELGRVRAELQDELGRVRAELQDELGRVRAELERERAEVDRQRVRAESVERERDDLRAELAALHSDNDRLRTEQVEAGETAAKLLGEMKELVNQVAHKFQGPSKSSPFAREPRSPQP